MYGNTFRNLVTLFMVELFMVVESGPLIPEKKIFEGVEPYMGMEAVLVM